MWCPCCSGGKTVLLSWSSLVSEMATAVGSVAGHRISVLHACSKHVIQLWVNEPKVGSLKKNKKWINRIHLYVQATVCTVSHRYTQTLALTLGIQQWRRAGCNSPKGSSREDRTVNSVRSSHGDTDQQSLVFSETPVTPMAAGGESHTVNHPGLQGSNWKMLLKQALPSWGLQSSTEDRQDMEEEKQCFSNCSVV